MLRVGSRRRVFLVQQEEEEGEAEVGQVGAVSCFLARYWQLVATIAREFSNITLMEEILIIGGMSFHKMADCFGWVVER